MTPSMCWDVFCRVVDNFGDIGVCWRLAAGLASRGQQVRLWADDARALQWMAPGGAPGVTVLPWTGEATAFEPGDVVVETFGCDPPADFVARMATRSTPPVWINLEYLSAESYVERSHRLRSPQASGPGRGLDKWFFYPGFTPATGGLLREPGLLAERDRFERGAWLAAHGIAARPGERLVSLFCYPGAALELLFGAWPGQPTLLLACPGAAAEALAGAQLPAGWRSQALPWLSQADYDRLLWACDLNAVRGEDSFVRAQWAGRPLLWHIYPQHDAAHDAKLEAFLARHL
ncbi:MAG TPA: elongation factor P maturation arginine rhamnosyltransferase EarP, partial [Ideonella sp.]|nr:elongation factor P maturation arginine rhamnosyltransferase EarP [Ideonella sp.]